MWIREITVAELESSKAGAEAAELAFHMDEQTFHVFYESTARPLWSYLSRILGQNEAARAADAGACVLRRVGSNS
jgi:hypothetical protein